MYTQCPGTFCIWCVDYSHPATQNCEAKLRVFDCSEVFLCRLWWPLHSCTITAHRNPRWDLCPKRSSGYYEVTSECCCSCCLLNGALSFRKQQQWHFICLCVCREVQFVVLSNIASISIKRKGMFEPYLKSFYVRSNDPTQVKLLKVNSKETMQEFDRLASTERKPFQSQVIHVTFLFMWTGKLSWQKNCCGFVVNFMGSCFSLKFWRISQLKQAYQPYSENFRWADKRVHFQNKRNTHKIVLGCKNKQTNKQTKKSFRSILRILSDLCYKSRPRVRCCHYSGNWQMCEQHWRDHWHLSQWTGWFAVQQKRYAKDKSACDGQTWFVLWAKVDTCLKLLQFTIPRVLFLWGGILWVQFQLTLPCFQKRLSEKAWSSSRSYCRCRYTQLISFWTNKSNCWWLNWCWIHKFTRVKCGTAKSNFQ